MKKYLIAIVIALVFSYTPAAQAEALSVTSFTQNQSSEFGGSTKLSWHITGASSVKIGITSSGIGIKNAETGELFPGVAYYEGTEGALYLKLTNATAVTKEATVTLLPIISESYPTTSIDDIQRILTISVPPSGISPVIQSLSPNTGRIGTEVTIHGRNFAPSGNWISFETTTQNEHGMKQWRYSSADGKTLTFTVPATLLGTSEKTTGIESIVMPVTPGTYQVAVENENGRNDVVYFEVVSASNTPVKNTSVSGNTSSNVSTSNPEKTPKALVNTSSSASTPQTSEKVKPIEVKNDTGTAVQTNTEVSLPPKKISFISKIFRSFLSWFK